jgi:hypothetical protein
MGSAAGVYVIMAALKFAADLTISKLFLPRETTHVVLAPILFLSTAAIGGCIASRIHRGVTILLAFMVAITVMVLIVIKLCTIPVPWLVPNWISDPRAAHGGGGGSNIRDAQSASGCARHLGKREKPGVLVVQSLWCWSSPKSTVPFCQT